MANRASVSLQSVRVVTRTLAVVPAAAVDALGRALAAELPAGYRAYVEALGAGELCGVLRVYAPDIVLEQREAHAKLRSFDDAERRWKNFAEMLLPADKPRLCPLASSIDGDELCVHLDDPTTLFVFPRHRDHAVPASTFEEALAWFAFSGAYWRRSACAWFLPSDGYDERHLAYDARRIDDLFDLLREGFSAEEIVEDEHGNTEHVFFPDRGGMAHVHDRFVRVIANPSDEDLFARVEAVVRGGGIDIGGWRAPARTT